MNTKKNKIGMQKGTHFKKKVISLKKNFLTMNLSTDVGNISEVSNYNYKFKRYKIEVIKGEKFIVGEDPLNLHIKEDIFNKPTLLFSLINLIDTTKPFPDFFDEEKLDRVISDEKVLKWVKQNGNPYADKRKHIRPNMLSLWGFKYSLAFLYTRFSLWDALLDQNENQIKKYIWLVEDDIAISEILTNKKEKEKLNAIKKNLAESITKGIHLDLTFDTKSQQYKFVLKTYNNLFNVASYQFATLMTKPNNEKEKHQKICKQCKSIFWAAHANAGYCENGCNRQTHNSRIRRAKEKRSDS